MPGTREGPCFYELKRLRSCWERRLPAGPGEEVHLKMRSVHAWAAPASRLEAGAPSAGVDVATLYAAPASRLEAGAPSAFRGRGRPVAPVPVCCVSPSPLEPGGRRTIAQGVQPQWREPPLRVELLALYLASCNLILDRLKSRASFPAIARVRWHELPDLHSLDQITESRATLRQLLIAHILRPLGRSSEDRGKPRRRRHSTGKCLIRFDRNDILTWHRV